MAGIIKHQWIFTGDFNEITAHEEKKGSSEGFTSTSFANSSYDNNMIDLGFLGQSYTWAKSKNCPNSIKVRLDRAICNQSWRLLFLEAHVTYMPRTTSDHCLILLETYSHRSGSKPQAF